MKPTVAELEQILPAIVECHARDFIAADRAGRICAVKGTDEVAPDGGARLIVGSMTSAELRRAFDPRLVRDVVRERERGKLPVVIVGRGGSGLVAVPIIAPD